MSCVNDYIEPVVIFTAWVKIYSTKYFCNAWAGQIFVQWKFSAIMLWLQHLAMKEPLPITSLYYIYIVTRKHSGQQILLEFQRWQL